jgi:hypothetical protein
LLTLTKKKASLSNNDAHGIDAELDRSSIDMSVVTLDGMRASIDESEVGKLGITDIPIKNPSGPNPHSNKVGINVRKCRACRRSKRGVGAPFCPEMF